MKRLSRTNINTKEYWNNAYLDADRVKRYDTELELLENNDHRFHLALSHIKNGDKVLDIGCGTGWFCKFIKDKYPDCVVYGTDISDKSMEMQRQQRDDITFVHGYVGNIQNVPTGYFDIVFAGEILEHLERPEDLFTEAHRFLKIGGKFIVTTPLLNKIDSTEHVWSYSASDIKELFEDFRFFNISVNILSDLIIFGVGEK